MRCLACRYDLRRLTVHRCPECGRAFDPNDPSTFSKSNGFTRRFWIVLLLIAVTIYLALFLGTFVKIRSERLPTVTNTSSGPVISTYPTSHQFSQFSISFSSGQPTITRVPASEVVFYSANAAVRQWLFAMIPLLFLCVVIFILKSIVKPT
jgi:hypothetical protein